MEPLDLTKAPPRSPHQAVAGVTFLARSIDKARAALPGGDLGDYHLNAVTSWMLEAFHKERDAFVEVVATANTDDEVAAWLLGETNPHVKDEWNAMIAVRKPRDGTREAAIGVFPWLVDHPELETILDILVEDDRRHFATV